MKRKLRKWKMWALVDGDTGVMAKPFNSTGSAEIFPLRASALQWKCDDETIVQVEVREMAARRRNG